MWFKHMDARDFKGNLLGCLSPLHRSSYWAGVDGAQWGIASLQLFLPLESPEPSFLVYLFRAQQRKW